MNTATEARGPGRPFAALAAPPRCASPARARTPRCPAASRARSTTRASRCPACRSSCASRDSPSRCSRTTRTVPMNPASVMKIITTYAALDLLGPDFRWKTEAYLAGKLDRKGTLAGNLVIKGYGDPKITIEQWQCVHGRAANERARDSHRRPGRSTARTSSCPSTTPPRSTRSRCGLTTSGRTRCWSTSRPCASRSCRRPRATPYR